MKEKDNTDNSERLLGARYRHFYDYEVSGYHVERVSNVSLYLNVQWTIAGVLFALLGAALSALGYVRGIGDLTSVGYFILGVGSSIVLSQFININRRKEELRWKRLEITKEQCYAWLLGINVVIGTLASEEEYQKELHYMEFLRFIHVLSISEDEIFPYRGSSKVAPWNTRYWNFELLYFALGGHLGYEWNKDIFFYGAAFVASTCYLHSQEKNDDAIKEIRSVFQEGKDSLFENLVFNLSLHGNKIITHKFIEEIFALIRASKPIEALEKAYTVKDRLEKWETNVLEQE